MNRQYQGPTVFDKLKMGMMMGGSVGLCLGFLMGSFSLLRYGPGNKGYLASLGQYMVL